MPFQMAFLFLSGWGKTIIVPPMQETITSNLHLFQALLPFEKSLRLLVREKGPKQLSAGF